MRKVNKFLEMVRDQEHADIHLQTIFRGACVSETDDLIEAMYVLGERRATKGNPVGLDEITDAVRELLSDQRVLDAAVDVCMRGLTSTGYTEEQAQRLLLESSNSMVQQESCPYADILIKSVQDTAPKHSDLPRDFGPVHSGTTPRYELRRLIGRGSQANVYEAVDRTFAEQDGASFVAIKIFFPTQEDRHTQEGARVRRIRHKNIARVIDQGLIETGERYVTYELIEGITLEKWRILNHEKLTAKSICRLVIPIAQGVQAAHNAGIVHRDLKPTNILMDSDGVPIVTDFGIAHSEIRPPVPSHSGSKGSLAFMAPEQYDGMVSGPMPCVDIYSLGGILFWLATGQYPNGDTVKEAVDWLNDRCDGGPARVDDWNVDERLRLIIAKSLSVDPASRHQSVESFAQDLESFLEHRAIPWLDRSALRQSVLFARRNPLVTSLIIFLCLSVLASGIIWGSASSKLQTERAQADLAREIESLQTQLTLEQLRVDQIKDKSALLRSVILTWKEVLQAGDDQGQAVTNLLFLQSMSLNSYIEEDPELLNELIAGKIEAGEELLEHLVAQSTSSIQVAIWHEVLAVWYVGVDNSKALEHLHVALSFVDQYAPMDVGWRQRILFQLESLMNDSAES